VLTTTKATDLKLNLMWPGFPASRHEVEASSALGLPAITKTAKKWAIKGGTASSIWLRQSAVAL
jgi:hypothetical protein